MSALTDTYLSTNIYNGEIYMGGFQTSGAYRKDGRAKSGVTIYLGNDLAANTEKN